MILKCLQINPIAYKMGDKVKAAANPIAYKMGDKMKAAAVTYNRPRKKTPKKR